MSEVVWNIVRKNSAFLHRRRGGDRNRSVELSSEPMNVAGVHNFKYSGVAQANKAVGVRVETVTRKGKSTRQAVLTRTVKGKRVSHRLARGVKAGNKSIFRSTGFFRHDLAKAAMQRFTQIRKSMRVVATPAAKKQRRQAAK